MTGILAYNMILNSIALFLFPPLGHLLGLTLKQFGMWAAIAIHDTSSVVGASARYGAKLYDVTHLPCHAARYTSADNNVCSPAMAQGNMFSVAPGGAMPLIKGCNKQEYSVLFVIGVAVED